MNTDDNVMCPLCGQPMETTIDECHVFCTNPKCRDCDPAVKMKITHRDSRTKQTLVFVINGENVDVQVTPDQTLAQARDLALAKSYNTGRSALDWDIYDPEGRVLPPETLVGQTTPPKLFLALKMAAICHTVGYQNATTTQATDGLEVISGLKAENNRLRILLRTLVMTLKIWLDCTATDEKSETPETQQRRIMMWALGEADRELLK